MEKSEDGKLSSHKQLLALSAQTYPFLLLIKLFERLSARVGLFSSTQKASEKTRTFFRLMKQWGCWDSLVACQIRAERI